MKYIKIATDYIMFNGIFKMIDNVNNLDEENSKILQNLVNIYIDNHGK